MSDTYIALKECGCMAAATVDSPERKRDVARSVASFIRDGLRVERVPSQDIRDGKYEFRCEVCDPEYAEQTSLKVKA